ncbi:MAG: dephospho-CoA kinase [Gammaproteobacteria bacterium]|nr:dephospho-CoA kinase [Gammaproteobacteria bacterium]MCP4088618.1 dephospho-CoA kinase [Gammaproteobacteria bacterium]MCP4276474.1 dephospho-CoA kinase [Gammaproteobacteria bacterium]MCP4832351.1 dephospho-CoA kinase [Gammaproteobacteria bacterium]MCP4929135.1 dephospho-CoA kinase [Gammaproteobacteria bacterium]
MTDKQTQVLHIGLTGGIASGKSAVANLFSSLGATVIDTDIIAREVVTPGQPGLAKIVAAFGTGILQADKKLDRAKLRKLVFSNPAYKEQLDTILHPLIRAETLAQAKSTAANSCYQIFVVPLLAETNFTSLVDRVLVIDCPIEIQRARLIARDKESITTADSLIASQASREDRLTIADDIICNDSDLAALEPAVQALHQHYLELAAAKSYRG